MTERRYSTNPVKDNSGFLSQNQVLVDIWTKSIDFSIVILLFS